MMLMVQFANCLAIVKDY